MQRMEVERAGLFTTTDEVIPLEGVRVDAEVRDIVARVTVTQRYRNRGQEPVEAVYVFPLDEGAAVCGFEAVIGDTHVVGEVKERDEAFAAYDDALAEGHGAYLLDEERPDVFTASVGNLPPGGTVLLRVTYVTELPAEGEAVRFVLPTTISPRYAPREDQIGVGKTPAEALNPPVAWQVPYGLELEVKAEMPAPIRRVESPSHGLSIAVEGTRALVRLASRSVPMDRDVVILFETTGRPRARSWVEVDEKGERAVMLVWEPELPEGPTFPGEVIFVVDRSGSMAGESIAEVRNALQLALRSLPEGTRFDIVGFGSDFEYLFGKPKTLTEKTLEQTSRYVDRMDADLGGTEILPALQSVLQQPVPEGGDRTVFLLTDGEVTNTDAVIRFVRSHSRRTRVFTFGIGPGASHHLIRGVARAGRGAAEHIYYGERIEKKVLRQLRRALGACWSDLQVDWGGLQVRQAPYHLPPVGKDSRLVVYGLIEGGEGDTVTLRGKGPQGEMAVPVALDLERPRRGRIMATLAARALIRDLEEEASPLHEHRGSLQKRRESVEERVRKEIVALGTRFGLCSSQTSFVAVERRETPTAGPSRLVKIPVALTRGWGGLDRRSGPAFAYAPPSAAPADVCAGAPVASAPRADLHFAPPEPKAAVRPLDRLVRLQRADGSWGLTKALARILGCTVSELEAALPPGKGSEEERRRAWATALALVWLEEQAANAREEWELLAEKARGWLRRVEDARELLAAAKGVVGGSSA